MVGVQLLQDFPGKALERGDGYHCEIKRAETCQSLFKPVHELVGLPLFSGAMSDSSNQSRTTLPRGVSWVEVSQE